MKKTIAIVFLAVTTLGSLGYGYAQKQRADELERIAQETKRIAEAQQVVAMQQEAVARRLMAQAEAQRVVAERAFAELKREVEKGRKK